MDSVQRFLRLLIPLIFLIGGAVTVILAILGTPRVFEESRNPNMQRQIERFGKTRTRIWNGLGGLLMAGFGAWLLHGLLCVPQ